MLSLFKNSEKERTLICGTGTFARSLADEIAARPHCGYRVIGLVAENGNENSVQCPYPVLGRLDQIQSIIASVQPARIIMALPQKRRMMPVDQLVEAKIGRSIRVENGDDVYENVTGKIAIEALTPSRIIFTEDFKVSPGTLICERLISLAAAAVGILMLAPLFLIIPLAIRLDSRGPVLFTQERVGMKGKIFTLFKFRSMHPAKERASEWAGDNAERITRVGRVLRKFRLDELPQFINVLRGDMNLVGPRPHPASNYEMLVLVSRNTPNCGVQIPYYSLRSLVRPGITGWAQVKYRYADNLQEEIEKLCFDLYYIKHCSVGLDFRILLETIKVVLAGHAHNTNEGEAALSDTTDSDTGIAQPMEVYTGKSDYQPAKNTAWASPADNPACRLSSES